MPLAVVDVPQHEPEFPDVVIHVSGQVLTEWANSKGPVRMVDLGEPDPDGFYAPTFQLDMSRCPRACCNKR